MCLNRGEGEKEIANHGWSRVVKVFTQETEATGQQRSRSDQNEPKLYTQSRVQDARDSRPQLPFFFFLKSYMMKNLIFKVIPGILLGTSLSFAEEVKEPKSKMIPFANRYMTAPEQKSPEEKLRQVADMYEKHFLREMTKGMRNTIGTGGFIKTNQAEKIFQEQLDEKYVENWGDRGGIGLSNMIYDQLVEKFGARLGIKARVAKPVGPLPLDEKSNYTAQQYSRRGKESAVSLRFDRKGPQKEITAEQGQVKSPWEGTVVAVRSLPDDQKLLEIIHDNGLKSQVAFQGELSKVSTGQKLQAGETLGVLSAGGKALYWSVEPGPDTVSE